MLLLHVPADRQNIQVISIMRDSWVEIPGRGENKINSALAFGGVPLVVQTLESLIGVRVDRVAIIDFEGFRGMTDALGGVTFTNPVSFRGTDNGYRYAQGEITVNGGQALEYVRERAAFRVSDYQRVRNQQAFLKGLMSEVLNAETLTNPARISALVEDVSPYVSVDSGFDFPFIASLAFELRDVRVDDVSFMTLPTTGTGTRRGQSVVLLDQVELAKIVAALRANAFSAYTPPESPL
jgi:LCP family protein required for cell wall assembly